MTSMKVLWRKLSRIHTYRLDTVARACNVREDNFYKWAQVYKNRESFSLESFPLYGMLS